MIDNASLDYSADRTWALAQLGNVIGAYVDREINKPTAIETSGGYGISDGRMYALGQPTGDAVVQPQQRADSTLLLLILGIAFLASRQ